MVGKPLFGGQERAAVWKAEAGICWKGQELIGLTRAALKAHQKENKVGQGSF